MVKHDLQYFISILSVFYLQVFYLQVFCTVVDFVSHLQYTYMYAITFSMYVCGDVPLQLIKLLFLSSPLVAGGYLPTSLYEPKLYIATS